jgi:hypothetical protein
MRAGVIAKVGDRYFQAPLIPGVIGWTEPELDGFRAPMSQGRRWPEIFFEPEVEVEELTPPVEGS